MPPVNLVMAIECRFTQCARARETPVGALASPSFTHLFSVAVPALACVIRASDRLGRPACVIRASDRLGRPALSPTPPVALPAHIPQMLPPAWRATAAPLGSRWQLLIWLAQPMD